MNHNSFGNIALTLGAFLALVHILGYLAQRLKQPRLVGEIFAGILLGPYILGKISPTLSVLLLDPQNTTHQTVLHFFSWLGLLLLMFLSGSESRHLLTKQNRKEAGWLLGVGTPVPFFTVIFLGLF